MTIETLISVSVILFSAGVSYGLLRAKINDLSININEINKNQVLTKHYIEKELANMNERIKFLENKVIEHDMLLTGKIK
jgi:hypothetical protein